jgi:hypothetical protein
MLGGNEALQHAQPLAVRAAMLVQCLPILSRSSLVLVLSGAEAAELFDIWQMSARRHLYQPVLHTDGTVLRSPVPWSWSLQSSPHRPGDPLTRQYQNRHRWLHGILAEHVASREKADGRFPLFISILPFPPIRPRSAASTCSPGLAVQTPDNHQPPCRSSNESCTMIPSSLTLPRSTTGGCLLWQPQ